MHVLSRPGSGAAGAVLAAGLPVSLVATLLTSDGGAFSLDAIPTREDIAELPPEITREDIAPFTRQVASAFEAPLPPGAAQRLVARTVRESGDFGNPGAETTFSLVTALSTTIAAADQRAARGRRVTHPRFGAGEILDVVPRGEGRAFRIRFDDGSERTILERFVEEG